MPVWEVYADDRVKAYGTYESALKDAPTTPSADNFRMFMYASGTTPNREVGVKLKLENATDVILCSTLV